jgi:putative oxidoreductase
MTLAPLLDRWEALTVRLRGAGEVVPLFAMRLVMGWEFFESGREKLAGDNWFADAQSSFPFPFDVVPPNLSWGLATWFELAGGIALWLGLATRFFAFSLLFLTFVATAAVHWPDMWTMWSDLAKGYSVSDQGHGNFKLPLLFVVMLLPLVFNGAGRLSLDHLIGRFVHLHVDEPPRLDAYAWAIAFTLLGLPFLMLMPAFGTTLLAAALACTLFARYARA